MNRLLLAAAGALLIGIGAASCSSTNPPAATVNGTDIKRADFQSEVSALAGNAKLMGGSKLNTLDMNRTDSWLKLNIRWAIVEQELKKRGITPTADMLKQSADQAPSAFTQNADPELWAAFPQDFRDRIVTRLANDMALRDVLSPVPSDAVLQTAYDKNPKQWGEQCLSHILVADDITAEGVQARLAKGENFAALAKELSTDTGSAPNGGSLKNTDGTCLRGGQYVAEFAAAASQATPGKPTEPVKTQFGYHILLVDSIKVLPFDQVKADITKQLQGDATKAFQDFLNTAYRAGTIKIDKRYGSWDPATSAVVPPAGAASGPTTTGPAGGDTATTVPGGSATTNG